MKLADQRSWGVWGKIGLSVLLLATGFGLNDSASEKVDSEPADLAGKGFGTENRNWVTEEENLQSGRYSVMAEENIEIPMRDGTILRGRLLLPIGVEEPLPVIVQLNGYGHISTSERVLKDLVGRGYAGLHVSLRGTGTSDGKKGLYNSYGEDGYDVIEWAAGQPWSSGKVGTVGISMTGISQWLAAKELPPSLEAISPSISCADCYEHLWQPGGMEAGPGRMARSAEYKAAKEHRNYDGWWKERSVSDGQLKAIADEGIAAFISGGWNDYISPGNIEAFETFSAAGGDSKLIVSAGAHAGLSDVLPYEFEDYQSLWFDHYLKGEENGVEERDPVLIYVQGANQWRYEKAWPIPDTRYADLFFNEEQSGSIDSVNDGSLTAMPPDHSEPAAGYAYSPEKGPFLPAHLDASGRLQADQQIYEENTVTWTTDPFAVPTESTGAVKVSFWAEVKGKDADFVLQVSDVSPYGTSRQVAVGYLNAARAESFSNPSLLKEGEIAKYTVELSPTSYVFEEGHRLRLSVAGGAKPLEEQESPQGPGLNKEASSVKIYQDAAHPSKLSLPIIGQDALSTRKATYAWPKELPADKLISIE